MTPTGHYTVISVGPSSRRMGSEVHMPCDISLRRLFPTLVAAQAP